MTLTFYPRAPRNADDGVDIWRYLLGLCVSDLPRGRSTVPAGGPLVPDDRAEYIREVLRGLTMDQQIIMTSAFVTTIRALMYEVGVIMHIASLSEPVALDPTTDEEPGPAGTRRDRDDHTSLLQMEVETGTLDAGVNLVQMDLSRVYGVVLRLQGALEGASAEVAGSRARVLLEKLRTQRGCGVLRDIELYNQLEALLVAVAGAGGQGEASEGAGSATEARDWSAHWWKALAPLLCQGETASGSAGPIQVNSSLEERRDLEDLAEEQDKERRDQVAMVEAQAQHEQEETDYYVSAEKAVLETMEEEEARAMQQWDDWALFDEMNSAPARSRKRPFVSVTMGPGPGAEGEARTFRLPMVVGRPMAVHVVVGQSYEVDEDNVTTVAAGPIAAGIRGVPEGGMVNGATEPQGHETGPITGVPLDVAEFQVAYGQWQTGSISDDDVITQYGPATLDMMQAQKILLQEEDGKMGHSGQEGPGLPWSNVQPEGGKVDEGSGPGCGVQHGEGGHVVVADTLLDVVLGTASVDAVATLGEEQGLQCGGCDGIVSSAGEVVNDGVEAPNMEGRREEMSG